MFFPYKRTDSQPKQKTHTQTTFLVHFPPSNHKHTHFHAYTHVPTHTLIEKMWNPPFEKPHVPHWKRKIQKPNQEIEKKQTNGSSSTISKVCNIWFPLGWHFYFNWLKSDDWLGKLQTFIIFFEANKTHTYTPKRWSSISYRSYFFFCFGSPVKIV